MLPSIPQENFLISLNVFVQSRGISSCEERSISKGTQEATGKNLFRVLRTLRGRAAGEGEESNVS